jgi:orotidine-5'-phosphate decarboxylase
MGRDSVVPFLEIGEKFIFVLALTSNQGSNDFQKLISNDKPIYNHIIEKTREWGGVDQLGYVIGATHPSQLEEIRNDVMDRVILIPGVGAQGGSVPEVIKANQGGPAFINVSRAVIYASAGHNFDMKAREMAESYATMFEILTK